MYNPEKFKASDPVWIAKIIQDHPFVTLITGEEISHLPLLLEERTDGLVLVGHLANANSHVKKLHQGNTLAIFHGPNAYITPTWYEESDVPTWNYMVVHARGQVRILADETQTISALRKLSEKMEGKDGWDFVIPEDLAGPGVLQKGITAFELKVEMLEAKFKLSQNRSPADQAGVIRGLELRADEQGRAVKEWMQKILS